MINKLLKRALQAHQQGQALQAELLYMQALEQAPEHPQAHNLLGVLRFQQGQPEEALAHFDRALRADPDFADAYNSRGNTLLEMGRPAPALENFAQALRCDPRNADALFNHASALQALDRHEEAAASLRRALALGSRDAATHLNLGVSLRALGREEEALECFERALRLDPDSAEALSGRGNALLALGRTEAALTSHRRAAALPGAGANVRFNLALAELATGNWESGWRNYETRHATRDFAGRTRPFAQPLWLGDADLAGRAILLHAEQGFGDTLMFSRYVPLVAARGARVILEVQPRLAELMRQLEGMAHVAAAGDALPAFDFHCPLPSLPRAFGTTVLTIPPPIPLRAPAANLARWRARLADVPRPRIGLVWSGSLAFRKDHSRSLALAELAPLLSLPGVHVVSLQKEVGTDDRALLAQHAIPDTGDDQQDFSDAAALVEEMDVVVSPDTALAHLAGTMGKPVCLLLSRAPDWRWLRDREDGVWYPRTRLFRQLRSDAPGWAQTVQRLTAALGSMPA